MTTETMNVDDMDATDSVEGSVTDMSGRAWRAASLTCLEGLGGQRHWHVWKGVEGSFTDMSGTADDGAAGKEVTFSYDGDDDDDGDEDDEENICREMAHLN